MMIVGTHHLPPPAPPQITCPGCQGRGEIDLHSTARQDSNGIWTITTVQCYGCEGTGTAGVDVARPCGSCQDNTIWIDDTPTCTTHDDLCPTCRPSNCYDCTGAL